jgi:hypothetical protein
MTSPSTSHIAHSARQTYRCVVIKYPLSLEVSGSQKASIKERGTLIPTLVLASFYKHTIFLGSTEIQQRNYSYTYINQPGARSDVLVKATNRQVAGSIPDGVSGIFQ